MRGPRAIPGLCGQFRVQLQVKSLAGPSEPREGRAGAQGIGEERGGEEKGRLLHARIAHSEHEWVRLISNILLH